MSTPSPASSPAVAHPNVVKPLNSNGNVDGNGVQAFYTYISRNLTDRADLKVNVGDGDLVLQSEDFHLAGTNLALTITRYYNAQATDRETDLSTGWNLSTGFDVFLSFNSDGSIDYLDPTGTDATFKSDGNGGYVDPKSLDATLVRISGVLYEVKYHKSGEILRFDKNGFLTGDEERNGNTITFSYSSTGQLVSAVDTQGRTTTFGYDSADRLTTMTDPVNRTVTYGYDSGGNLVAATDMAGNTTTYGYLPGTHLLTQITDTMGKVTTIGYDSSDEVTSLTDPTGAVTGFTYNGGDSTVVTDARGNQTTYSHDDAIRITKSTDALGNSQSKTYTSDSNIATVSDALGSTTSLTYDANNNVSTATEPTGAKTTLTYNDSKHPYLPDTQTDPQGNTLGFVYDKPGNLIQVKDTSGTGMKESYAYNSDGTLAAYTDGNGNKTTYTYDTKGNLITKTPPSPLGPTAFTYDAASRVTTETDGNGHTTTFSYDDLNHMTKVSYADGSSVAYTYDADGNVVQVADSIGTTAFSYDQDNRETRKTLPNGIVLAYAYDAVGNPVSYTDQGGTVTYAYNEVNLLTTLTEPGGAQTTFAYDKNYHRTQTSYPNGVVVAVTYDKAGHPTGVNAANSISLLAEYKYDYGGTDLRQSTFDKVVNQFTYYTYDTLNRLVTAKVVDNSSGNTVGKFHYNFDADSNITAQTVNDGTPNTFTYDAANELTSTSQGVSYSYDSNGNRTAVSSPSTTFSYNPANQTTAINNIPMTYSGIGQTERVGAGSANYTNSALGVASRTDTSSITNFTRDTKGTLIDERTPSGTYYYLLDGQGSVVGLTDVNGNLVGNERYQYDPYGNLRTNPSAAQLQSNPWRFTGGQYDSTTGYYKLGNRYYDPVAGDWTQQDTQNGNPREPASQNKCAYAQDNPVNRIDPTGNASVLDNFGACVGSIFGGILWVASGAFGALSFITAGEAGCAVTAGTVCAAFGIAAAAVFLATVGFCIGWATTQSILQPDAPAVFPGL